MKAVDKFFAIFLECFFYYSCRKIAISCLLVCLSKGIASNEMSSKKITFFKYFFWCAPFGYLYFLYFIILNEPGLDAGIDPGMVLTPLPSSIGRGLIPRPSNREPSTLPLSLDHSFRYEKKITLNKIISNETTWILEELFYLVSDRPRTFFLLMGVH
jgi:hypothetical protein